MCVLFAYTKLQCSATVPLDVGQGLVGGAHPVLEHGRHELGRQRGCVGRSCSGQRGKQCRIDVRIRLVVVLNMYSQMSSRSYPEHVFADMRFSSHMRQQCRLDVSIQLVVVSSLGSEKYTCKFHVRIQGGQAHWPRLSP
jgi:hypothetical protein